MTINPKISVIMSVYNGMPLGPQSASWRTRTASSAYSQKSSAYLKQAVESILYQTYKNFEFIILDDASTDNSWQYLKSLKDKRIKLLKNKKNLGLAKSLNRTIGKASGDYIARMDADDISLPERFEQQLHFMIKNPSIDLCGTWADLINESGQIIGEKKYPTKDKDIKKALNWYSAIIHPTFMARKKVYRKLKGYNPKFDLAEDYEFLLRAKREYKMANIPQKLLLWRLWNKRRSRKEMEKMDRVDLRIKMEAFKRGDFGPLYTVTLIKKLLMTYLLPMPIKLKLAKMFKFA